MQIISKTPLISNNSGLQAQNFDKTSNQTLKQTAAVVSFSWVFAVQRDWIEKCVSANAEKRVDINLKFLYA